jgi:hypothetical protein
MKFKLFLFFATAMLAYNALWAQVDQKEDVKMAVRQLFEGMKKGDSAAVSRVFADKVVFQTVIDKKDGTVSVSDGDVQAFLKAIGTPHTDVWDERIEFSSVLIDGNLASVWTPYKFYLGDKLLHCGVNCFQLVKLGGVWKIVYLIDTRRKDCM